MVRGGGYLLGESGGRGRVMVEESAEVTMFIRIVWI